MLAGALWSIFKINLGVKPKERVLVFTDKPWARDLVASEDAERREGLRHITRLAAETARGLCQEVIHIEYPAGGAHGKEPPRKLWEAAFGTRTVLALDEAGLLKPLLNKKLKPEFMAQVIEIVTRYKADAVSAIVGLSNYSTSHTTFRVLLTLHCGTRYASMPLFDPRMLSGAMTVDWKALETRTNQIARRIRGAQSVRITTPDGTDISFDVRSRRVYEDAGNLRRAGSFGNLPAGEVFLAPVEGTAKGTLVLNWAPTRKLTSAIMVTIADGVVTRIDGHEPYAVVLADQLVSNPDNRNVAELGIGTNDKAVRPDNILESEKILGTIHIALGDNHSFGGHVRTPFHQDFVFFKPTLIVIDREGKRQTVLRGGKLV